MRHHVMSSLSKARLQLADVLHCLQEEGRLVQLVTVRYELPQSIEPALQQSLSPRGTKASTSFSQRTGSLLLQRTLH